MFDGCLLGSPGHFLIRWSGLMPFYSYDKGNPQDSPLFLFVFTSIEAHEFTFFFFLSTFL